MVNTEEEKERSSILLETHFPDSEHISITEISMNHTKNFRKEFWYNAKKLFTRQRFEWAISTFQPYESPEVDGMFPILLHKGVEEILPHLLKITRKRAFGQIPSKWITAKVTFIPKVGRKNGYDPRSFRSI